MADLKRSESSPPGEKGDTRWFSYTSTAQTQRLWPRLIERRADLPAVFLRDGTFDGEVFPYTVLIPDNVVFVNGRAVRTRQTIVALFDDRVLVLDNKRAAVERKVHLLDRIRYLRVEEVLLSGVLEVSSDSGSSRAGFNAARDNLFLPVFAAVRERFNRGTGTGRTAPKALRERLEAVPGITLKFVNYGMRSLPPGQEVRAVLYKESMNLKTARRGIFRLIDRYSAPVLLIKTDGELIVIEEPAGVRSRKKMEYGGIFTFIPLEKIRDMSVAPGVPPRLTIGLKDGDAVGVTLPDADGLVGLR